MGFKAKKLQYLEAYNTFWDLGKLMFTKKILIQSAFLVIVLLILIFYRSFLVAQAKSLAGHVGQGVATVVSESFGDEMKKDDFHHINVLIIGVGGTEHQGGFLSDSIMAASFDPEINAVSFLSIPRDLYVKKPNLEYGKINGILPNALSIYKGDMNQAAMTLAKKISEITGVPLNYYALIDFNGFIKLIDQLGGIDVYVPQDLVDNEYPENEQVYTTFKIDKGWHKLDGATALKYARSRHSTSDFSRSMRQQDIIKAIVGQLTQTKNLTNPKAITDLYNTFKSIITTNISLKEMIGMVKYAATPKDFFSFQYTANCGYEDPKLMVAGCELYYPNMEIFNGASVLLANGATPAKIEEFKKTQDFAFFAVYNQEMLKEAPKVMVLNGVDKDLAKKKLSTLSRNGLATKFAVKLKKYTFEIVGTANADHTYDKTTVIINGTGSYKNTLDVMKLLVDIAEVKTGDLLNSSGANITLIIGNDYIDKLKGKTFSYDLSR